MEQDWALPGDIHRRQPPRHTMLRLIYAAFFQGSITTAAEPPDELGMAVAAQEADPALRGRAVRSARQVRSPPASRMRSQSAFLFQARLRRVAQTRLCQLRRRPKPVGNRLFTYNCRIWLG